LQERFYEDPAKAAKAWADYRQKLAAVDAAMKAQHQADINLRLEYAKTIVNNDLLAIFEIFGGPVGGIVAPAIRGDGKGVALAAGLEALPLVGKLGGLIKKTVQGVNEVRGARAVARVASHADDVGVVERVIDAAPAGVARSSSAARVLGAADMPAVPTRVVATSSAAVDDVASAAPLATSAAAHTADAAAEARAVLSLTEEAAPAAQRVAAVGDVSQNASRTARAPVDLRQIVSGPILQSLARAGKPMVAPARFMKKNVIERYVKPVVLTQSDVIGRFDADFANLGLRSKVDVAFQKIETVFGSKYAAAIRKKFDGLGLQGMKGNDTLGIFLATKKGGTITMNTNIGNPEFFASVLLHEVRHFRQFEKLGSNLSEWNQLPTEFVERFATATQLWQGKRLGLAKDEMNMVTDYYNAWR
jgi:hypothetical protein